MVYCLVFIRKLNKIFLVAMRIGETPVPIPNTTVKTYTADGTALETMWESRWAPGHKKEKLVLPVIREPKGFDFLMTDKNSVRYVP